MTAQSDALPVRCPEVEMVVSTYRDETGGRRGTRVVFDVARARVWAGLLTSLLMMFLSAVGGVMATANRVVPPLARAAMAEDLARLSATDVRIERTIEKVERDGVARDAENMQAIRQEMVALQDALKENSRITSELLLQMARGRLAQENRR